MDFHIENTTTSSILFVDLYNKFMYLVKCMSCQLLFDKTKPLKVVLIIFYLLYTHIPHRRRILFERLIYSLHFPYFKLIKTVSMES